MDEEDSEDDTIRPLSDQCADEVERVLEERAISVQLHPEIDDACRADLTRFCIAATDVGQEMKCLQVGAIFILRKGVFGLFQTTHLPL